MKAKFLILIAFIAALSSCVKEPSYPIEPVIEFKSVSSDYVLTGYSDTLTVTFTDGDGDIGVNPDLNDSCPNSGCNVKLGDSSCFYSNSFNVFVIDSRDTCVATYASANVESTGKFKALSGEISIIVPVDSKKCFPAPAPGCPNETFFYWIVIRDKAGNFSNTVRTTDITVDGDY